MQKRLLIHFFLFLILAILPVSLFAETLKVGYFDIKPHISLSEEGKPVGAGVDYFLALAREMQVDIQWVGPLPFKRLFEELRKGKVDASFLFQKNTQREKVFFYPDKPFYLTRSVLALLKKHPLKEIKTVDDLLGIKIGLIMGAQPSVFIKSNIDKLDIEYIAGETGVSTNYRKLKMGRIDAVHTHTKIAVLTEAKKLGMQDDINILQLPEMPTELYFVISKKSTIGGKVLRKYNSAASELNIDYINCLKKYIDIQ